jgi:hypothetical protein
MALHETEGLAATMRALLPHNVSATYAALAAADCALVKVSGNGKGLRYAVKDPDNGEATKMVTLLGLPTGDATVVNGAMAIGHAFRLAGVKGSATDNVQAWTDAYGRYGVGDDIVKRASGLLAGFIAGTDHTATALRAALHPVPVTPTGDEEPPVSGNGGGNTPATPEGQASTMRRIADKATGDTPTVEAADAGITAAMDYIARLAPHASPRVQALVGFKPGTTQKQTA